MNYFLYIFVLITNVRFIFGLAVLFEEGDECLLRSGEGYCKSAFDCQWIRDEKIHEDHWTHCNYGYTNYLICCKDPEFTLRDSLDCHTDTQDIFSEATLRECLKRKNDSMDPLLPRFETRISFDNIFYTEEQCRTLHEEYQRREAEKLPIQGVAHGVDAEVGEFPFMVAIATLQPNGEYKRDCGGTIITKRHILTTAHCINHHVEEYVKKAIVRVGSIRTDDGIVMKLSKPPIYHPAFKGTGGGYDIAILHLSEDIIFNTDTYPACLYHGKEPLKIESRATVIGFGMTNETDNPDFLQKAEINIKNGLFCAPGIIQKSNFNGIKPEQICAGDSNVKSDTCMGDSGGPLIQSFNEEWKTVIGLTSFGPSTCNSNIIPGVYTRVSSFIEWIKEIVEKDFAKTNESVGRR